MQELRDILSILKHPGNPVDSFTRPSSSGPILLSTKSVSISKLYVIGRTAGSLCAQPS